MHKMYLAAKRIIGLAAAITTFGIMPSACAKQAPDRRAASRQTSDSAQRVRQTTGQAAGEVATATPSSLDTTTPGTTRVKWLSDANILSLLGIMNGRQVAAANIELQAWHSDTVRAFASSIARDYAELQHSVDSLAEGIKMAPIAPALATNVLATMQPPIDSLTGYRGAALDRAFVSQQIAAQRFIGGYVDQLSGDAERPEITAMLATAVERVGSDLARAQALQASLILSDSLAAADSAAKRAAKKQSAQR